VCLVKYFCPDESHYCFRLDSNSDIKKATISLMDYLNIMFPLLNLSHEHPSEQKEQLSDTKDRRTDSPNGKSL